jgi:hypothetical protein
MGDQELFGFVRAVRARAGTLATLLPPFVAWLAIACGTPTETASGAAPVSAAATAPVDTTPEAIPSAFEQDLAVFRDARGKPWSEALQPAVDAARRIFDGIPWIGRDAASVERALGPPDERGERGWRYIRHNGESGVIRVLRFDGGRVVGVDAEPTQ